jgi:hypothetical protein
MNALQTLIRATGNRAYESQHYGNSGEHCERQLSGRSPYYDADTRRYFGARVMDVSTDADGAMLFTVESVSPPSGARLYRMVAFDVYGTVVFRTEHETDGFNGWKTAAQARKELTAYRESVNVMEVTTKAMMNKVKALKDEAATLVDALAQRATL